MGVHRRVPFKLKIKLGISLSHPVQQCVHADLMGGCGQARPILFEVHALHRSRRLFEGFDAVHFGFNEGHQVIHAQQRKSRPFWSVAPQANDHDA